MDEFESVTLINPLDKPFELIYNNSLKRTIPAHGSMVVPWNPLGIIGHKHLIDACCNENNENSGDPAIRAKWESKVLVRHGQNLGEAPLNPTQVLQRKLDLLNKTNDSEAVKVCQTCNTKVFNLPEHNALNHEEAPTQAPQTPASQPTERPDLQKENAKILANAVGGREAKELPEQKIEEQPQAPVEEKPKEMTREALIAYARDVQKMNVDDPTTKNFLETKELDVIAKEIGYNI